MPKSLTDIAREIKNSTMIAIDNIEEDKIGYDDDFGDMQEDALIEYVTLLMGGNLPLRVSAALEIIIDELRIVAKESKE